MIRFWIFILAASVGGCATYYDKPGATQADFERDAAHCRLVAAGVSPQRTPSPPPTYTATTQAYGNTYVTRVAPNQDAGAPLRQAGDSLATAAAKRSAERDCMLSLGWQNAQPPASDTSGNVDCNFPRIGKVYTTRRACEANGGSVIR